MAHATKLHTGEQFFLLASRGVLNPKEEDAGDSDEPSESDDETEPTTEAASGTDPSDIMCSDFQSAQQVR